jgi:hypothetical protein
MPNTISARPVFTASGAPIAAAGNIGCHLLAWLRRGWLAARRHAERPDRFVPYC